MEQFFDRQVRQFIENAKKHDVKMLLIGGGAVNFHGYQRSSADLGFGIDTSADNLNKLIRTLQDCGYDIKSFPDAVKRQEQNISIKISPIAEIELITRFDPGKSFEDAFTNGEEAFILDQPLVKYRVLSYEDLLESKFRSARPKDLLDIQELQRIRGEEE